MNVNELRQKLVDFRYFDVDIYDKYHSEMRGDFGLFETLDITVGEHYEDGLRVRIFFNLTEEQLNLLDSPYGEWVAYPQGILYFPSHGEWWESEPFHIHYLSEISDEEQQKHDALLRILAHFFWLAADLSNEIAMYPGKSPTEHLKGSAFVNQPEVWAYLPHIFRWWNTVGLPLWSPLDFFEKTFRQVQEEETERQGYVYLIEGVAGWFKIGRSREPLERIERLGVVLPFPIKTKHLIRTDDMYRAEIRLHEIFSDRRGRGEWFQLAEDEVQAICGLKDIFFMPKLAQDY